MAYKIVNDDSLTDVANAIRVQGSISGTLEFPDGFVSAIQNLSPSAPEMSLPTTLSSSPQGNMVAHIFPNTSQTSYLNIPSGNNSSEKYYQIRPMMVDTKSITSNGTYTASDDDLDGYTEVTVNVGNNDFIVTLSWDDDYFAQDEGAWIPDCTINELQSAYTSEKKIVFAGENKEPATWFYDDDYAFVYGIYVEGGINETIIKEYVFTTEGIEFAGDTPFIYPYFDSPSRTYTPTTSTQTETIAYNPSNYNGIDHVSVTVNPIPSQYIVPSGTYSITSNGTYDVTQYATADVNVSGGGGSGDSLTLLATQNLGALSTTSTSAVEIATRVVVPNINDYELLIVLCQRSESVFSYHVATLGFVALTNTNGNFHTKANPQALSPTINYRHAGDVGIKSVQYNTTGIYPSYASLSDGTVTLTLSMKYNSSRTNKIDGNYTAKVYGAKFADLFNL